MSKPGTCSTRGPVATEGELSVAPAILVRTLEGRITSWSAAMERRYGFTSHEALGQAAHELLRTVFWKSRHEIEAILLERGSWTGGFIHRRSDGGLVMTAHRWHLHEADDGGETLLSELHSDIMVNDPHDAAVLADIIGGIGQQLSQPLTVVGNYLGGASRLPRQSLPDDARLIQALATAAEQVERIREGMDLFRQLGDVLRPPAGSAVTKPAERAAATAASGSTEDNDQ